MGVRIGLLRNAFFILWIKYNFPQLEITNKFWDFKGGPLMNDRVDTIIPRDVFLHSLRYWWLLALVSFAGGAVGFLLFQFKPPLYETRAIISVGIDFTQTGYLTDIEEDQMIGMVGDVISSTEVINKVEMIARNENLIGDDESVRKYLQLERWGFRWAARAQHNDPQIAAKLSNLWAETAMNTLEESYKHSSIAEGISRYILSLESCLQYLVVNEPVHGLCSMNDLDELQTELGIASEELKVEMVKAKGITPATQLALSEIASIPDQPVRYGLNLLVFSGAILGFVFGIFIIEFLIPMKICKE